MRRRNRAATGDDAASAGVARRLEEIVAAAERAARAVIDDAEAEAQRRLREADARADRIAAERLATLADLTEALREQAEAIGGHTERLLEALREAGAEIAEQEGRAPDSGAERRARRDPDPQPAPPAEREEGPPTGPRRAHLSAVEAPASGREPAGARLLATQMAVSGSSREEIDDRLRNGFKIEDTSAILDAILGPED